MINGPQDIDVIFDDLQQLPDGQQDIFVERLFVDPQQNVYEQPI